MVALMAVTGELKTGQTPLDPDEAAGLPEFSSGSRTQRVADSVLRRRYIDALRAADAGGYQPLLQFVGT